MVALAIWSRNSGLNLGRSDHSVPRARDQVGQPGLGGGRNLRDRRRTRLVGDRQHLELAVTIERERAGNVAEKDIDMAAQHVVVDQRFAAIRHMDHAGAGHGHEHVGGEMRGIATALAAIDHLAGIRLHVLDQFLDRIHRQVLAHDHEIGDRAENGDRHEILGLVGQLLVQALVDGERRRCRHQQGVAVGLGLRGNVRRRCCRRRRCGSR